MSSGRILRRFFGTWGLLMDGHKWRSTTWAKLGIDGEMWRIFIIKYGRELDEGE